MKIPMRATPFMVLLATLAGCASQPKPLNHSKNEFFTTFLPGKIAFFCSFPDTVSCPEILAGLRERGVDAAEGRKILPSGDPYSANGRQLLKKVGIDTIVKVYQPRASSDTLHITIQNVEERSPRQQTTDPPLSLAIIQDVIKESLKQKS